MSEPDIEERVGTLEIAIRQIMDETGVPRMPSGQPLYQSAYGSGLAAFVEKSIVRSDSRGWRYTVEVLGVLAFVYGILSLIAGHFNVR